MKNLSLAAKKSDVVSVVYFMIALSIVLFAPLLKHQMITGTVVNATFFAVASILGIRAGMAIGIFPSLMALSVGLLPSVLAPMVPFIMAGNVLLVFTFGLLRKKNYWLAMAVSAFAKFIFLFASSRIVVGLIIEKGLAQKAAAMMSWPQLITALAGGAMAYLIIKRFGNGKQK